MVINMEKSSSAHDKSKSKVSTASAERVHDGHRERLRRRFRAEGLDHFEPHQTLELFLTICIPRKDVNDLAHRLIDRFGSLAGVLDASEAELCTVPGIGSSAAFALHLLPAMYRQYAMDITAPKAPLDTAAKMTEYLQAMYVGVCHEVAYLLLFDNSMHLLDCLCVGKGSVNCVNIDLRTLLGRVLEMNATCAVLAHNHPFGPALPSSEDHALTDFLVGALDMVQVRLLEHFLISQSVCIGILRKSRGLLRASPHTGEPDEAYWRTFYGESSEEAPAHIGTNEA